MFTIVFVGPIEGILGQRKFIFRVCNFFGKGGVRSCSHTSKERRQHCFFGQGLDRSFGGTYRFKVLTSIFPFRVGRFNATKRGRERRVLLFIPKVFPVVFGRTSLHRVIGGFYGMDFILTHNLGRLQRNRTLIRFRFGHGLYRFVHCRNNGSPVFKIVCHRFFTRFKRPQRFVGRTIHGLYTRLCSGLPQQLITIVFVVVRGTLHTQVQFTLKLRFIGFVFVRGARSPSLCTLFLPLIGFIGRPIYPFICTLTHFYTSGGGLYVKISFLGVFFTFFGVGVGVQRRVSFVCGRGVTG